MSQISGVVQAINKKDVSGGRTSYDIVVGGESYGCGLYPPKTEVGKYVTFELDESRGYKNVGRNTLKSSYNKGAPDAGATTPAASGEAAPTAAPTKPYVDTKQPIIERQSAANTAVAFLAILTQQDAIAYPAKATAGTKAKVLTTVLRKLETDFYERNTGKVYVDNTPNATPEAAPDDVADDDVAAEPDKNWE